MSAPPTILEEAAADRAFPALELPSWADRFGLAAGITTRGDGFNLGLLTDAPAATVLHGWRTFADAMRPAFPSIVVGLQVHGRQVAAHGAAVPGWRILDGIDGHATAHAGILLAVTVADCVPVYLSHRPTGAAALLHAGWRGVAGGILEAGIEALVQVAGAPTHEIAMHCGVSICGSCYEVGPDVITAVTGRSAREPGPLDLRTVLADRAAAAGLQDVSTSPWCSAHHAERFFSHRRSRGADGRMVAYLGRPVA